MGEKNAIVLSVGGTNNPLIYCLENYDHDLIYFLHSKKTFYNAFEIIEQLDIPMEICRFKLTDHQNLDDSFAKSREIVKELQQENYNIHVEFTGGTKPMAAGLVLATIGENCNYTYVGTDSKRTKGDVGLVKSGYEEIKEQIDPYDLYAVIELQRGKDCFNDYQFSAAKANFNTAFKKLKSFKDKELCRLFLVTVTLYSIWDKFGNLIGDNVELNKFLENNVLKPLEQFDSFKEEYPDFIPQIKENIKFLELKLSEGGKIEPENVKYYISDLLNNAYRRIKEEKYDDAVARLYRTIELIGQLNLVDFDIINDEKLRESKKFIISKDKVLNHEDKNLMVPVTNQSQFEKSGRNFGMALNQTYGLLKDMGVPVAKRYDKDLDIQSSISLRNTSILAHGLNNIDKSQAKKFYRQVLKYAKEVFPEVKKYMKMASFPKFES